MIYLITRTDRTDYDEYDGIVVRASSEDEALSVVRKTDRYGDSEFRGFRPDGTNAKVALVPEDGDVEVILSSFCAG